MIIFPINALAILLVLTGCMKQPDSIEIYNQHVTEFNAGNLK